MSWRGMSYGWWCGNCRKSPKPVSPQTPTGDVRKTVDNTISPEAVAGPTGQPPWTVEARLRRPGVDNYVETIHVRASSKPGALAVAQEVLLDWIDGDAYETEA
jgi:hypothetical protein